MVNSESDLYELQIHPDLEAEASVEVRPTHAVNTRNVLIIVERRKLVRDWIVCWLERQGDFEVVADADLAKVDALERAAAVVLVLGPLDQWNGWTDYQVAKIRKSWPAASVILIVEPDELSGVQELVSRLGLQGFIPTSSSIDVAATAIREVVAGGRFLPSFVSNVALWPMLSRRQEAVLGQLASGTPDKVIAFRLGLSVNTVKGHVHAIIRKFRVGNRSQAVLAARERNYRANTNTA